MDPMTIAALANAAVSAGQSIFNFLQDDDGEVDRAILEGQRELQRTIAEGRRDESLSLLEQIVDMQKKGFRRSEDLTDEQLALVQELLGMSKAPRSDAFGNRTSYSPTRGFTTELTDNTREILSGEENALLREQEMARQGGEDYSRARNELLHGPRMSEEEAIDDITRLLMINRRQGLDEGVNTIGRQALRANMSSQLPKLVKLADERYGDSLEELILRGRIEGRKDYQNAEGFRQDRLRQQMGDFSRVAQSSPTSGKDKAIASTQNDALSTLLNQINNAMSTYGGAANRAGGLDQVSRSIADLARGVGNTGDLSYYSSDYRGGSSPNQLDLSWANDLINVLAKPTSSEHPKDQSRLKPSYVR